MNKINRDEIPDDVEAVVTFANDEPLYYKTIDGVLYVELFRDDGFSKSHFADFDALKAEFGNRRHIRPVKSEWTVCNNTLPMSKLSNEQAAELFNHWRNGGVVEVIILDEASIEAEYPSFYPELIYRAKQKTERELFVELALKAAKEGKAECDVTFAEAMFDAGFKAPKVGG